MAEAVLEIKGTTVTIKEMQAKELEYCNLRKDVGWHIPKKENVILSLSGSLYSVCAFDGERLVGFGRIVGDGGLYFYIQDLIIQPSFQGNGIGSRIMEMLMTRAFELAPPHCGAYIGLMVAPGLESFYETFGFKKLPGQSPAMCIWRNGH